MISFLVKVNGILVKVYGIRHYSFIDLILPCFSHKYLASRAYHPLVAPILPATCKECFYHTMVTAGLAVVRRFSRQTVVFKLHFSSYNQRLCELLASCRMFK
jgi:hypothetical protein